MEFTTIKKDRPTRTISSAKSSAIEAIGTLSPGIRLFGMTKGQFSLLDLISAILKQTGPADVIVSTWTTGISDAENARALLEKGDIRSMQLLTDRSFQTRQPQYCRRMVEVFGQEAIRVTRTHAKFALIQNDGWNIVVRSSMNLNKNPRFEQFDLDDDADLYEFLFQHVQEIFDKTPAGLIVPVERVDTVFSEALGGGLSEVHGLDGTTDEIHTGKGGEDLRRFARW